MTVVGRTVTLYDIVCREIQRFTSERMGEDAPEYQEQEAPITTTPEKMPFPEGRVHIESNYILTKKQLVQIQSVIEVYVLTKGFEVHPPTFGNRDEISLFKKNGKLVGTAIIRKKTKGRNEKKILTIISTEFYG